MKRNLTLLLVLLAFPASVLPDTGGHGDNGTPILLAQNDSNNQRRSTRKNAPEISTPLPPPKIGIETEKEIKGALGGIKEKNTGEATEPQMGNSVEDMVKNAQQVIANDAKAKQQGTVPPTAAPGTSAPTGAVAGAVAAGAQAAGAIAQGDSTAQRGGPPPPPSGAGVPPDIMAVQARQRVAEQNLSTNLFEELSILNVPTANLRTLKYIIDDTYRLRGMAYGDEQGYIHVLDSDADGNFKEIWKSPRVNSPIRGLFVEDLDSDGKTEIIAYTADGNFFVYGYLSHDLIYRTPEGTYQNINCMVIHNMDSDPQKEIFFIGVKPDSGADSGEPAGNFIQFDIKSKFEEWTSSDLYTATDMVVGNVDTDSDPELVLNTGEIINIQFKDIKWRSTVELGSRLYLVDMDSDGILELVTEYGESYVRIIDVDQRQEKW